MNIKLFGDPRPLSLLGSRYKRKKEPTFLGDFIGDCAKKKEEAAPSQSMASRLSNNKGTNLPPMASEFAGENEMASRQRNEIPLAEHKNCPRAKARDARTRPYGLNGSDD